MNWKLLRAYELCVTPTHLPPHFVEAL